MLAPESLSVPAVKVSPPVPLMTPPNVLLALESVSVFAPSVTPPEPERVVIVVPPLVRLEMSNVP